MEKVCEFCMALRPVIYCQADAAQLCLSCDAKVHSANAVSNRHLRSLLCDSCRYHPAYAHCLDHKMYICRNCDRRIHDGSCQHRKQAINSYMGSPSANDFAQLWDLDLSQWGNLACTGPSVSSSHKFMDLGTITADTSGSVCPGECNVGSRNQQRAKTSCNSQQNQSSCFIMRQIFDLRKLQLNEKMDNLPLISDQEQNYLSPSFSHSPRKFNETTDQSLQSCHDLSGERNTLLRDLNVETFPSAFSTLGNVPSSSTSGNPSPWQSESIWQCRSPSQTSQFWAQNMQDLGVCEDLVCHDNLNIPEVDVTFQNYEELFGREQDTIRALLDESELACSSVDKDVPLDDSENSHAELLQDISVATSVCFGATPVMDGDTVLTNQVNFIQRGTLDLCPSIRRSYSMLSPSISRLSSESTGLDSLESGLSPSIIRGEQQCDSHEEGRQTDMMSNTHREKPRRGTFLLPGMRKEFRMHPEEGEQQMRGSV
ncbi:putative zinc finger protein At1g68190 isoform X2 [Rhodamnia argentea]|uniref:Zinc finger protein At1g68190 isoform X2 n=1 Tax=Rhodamnia argentea TaxID=178133 RepID=A0A8B8MWI6_9MYRT|nr:putative zinc finger protein At1g68190 isoform X2 [Rhodamnia argentea]